MIQKAIIILQSTHIIEKNLWYVSSVRIKDLLSESMSTKTISIICHLKEDGNKADESDTAARYRYYSYRLGKQNDSGRDSFIFAEPEFYSTTRLQTTVIQSKWDSRLVLVLLALKFHSDSGLPIRDSIFFLLPARQDEFSTRFNLATYACPCTLVHTTWMSARTRVNTKRWIPNREEISRSTFVSKLYVQDISFSSRKKRHQYIIRISYVNTLLKTYNRNVKIINSANYSAGYEPV